MNFNIHFNNYDMNNYQDNKNSVWSKLRELGEEEFVQIMLSPPTNIPQSIIPGMPHENVQKMYNGRSYLELMPSCVAFLKKCLILQKKYLLPHVDSIKVLDYGCGWGRLLRIVQYFANEKNIYGVDPLQSSLEICRSCGINNNLSICQQVPSTLDAPLNSFDFIYSWSVFTHLSLKAMSSILNMLPNYISSKGIFFITIRPQEFWNYYHKIGKITFKEFDLLINQHQDVGYAFRPLKQGWKTIDNEMHFGDTSISLDFFKKNFLCWNILETFMMPEEPLQQCVVVSPNFEKINRSN